MSFPSRHWAIPMKRLFSLPWRRSLASHIQSESKGRRSSRRDRLARAKLTVESLESRLVLDGFSAVMRWPGQAVHAVMLGTGNVLFWGYTADSYRIWNPTTNTISTISQNDNNHLCAGHCVMPDGRVMVVGGGGGEPDINPELDFRVDIYDPFADSWTRLPDMAGGRWYPTNTTLGNGDIFVSSGTQADKSVNIIPQIWQTTANTWSYPSPNSRLGQAVYPRDFVAPNGKIFEAGPTPHSYYFDTFGSGNWTRVADLKFGLRSEGPAVLYADGKIVYFGGSKLGELGTATATVEVIDLNQPQPAWRFVSPMHFARVNANATLMPDGKIFIDGGTEGTANSVLPCEIWDPDTETCTIVSSLSAAKNYHSSALLLPDASILVAGGVSHPDAQIYYPDYLYRGSRPTITEAPSTVDLGTTFFVRTPDAASIQKVSWVRMGSATHAFNPDQRINFLNFQATADGLEVTAPSSANLAVPGYYMLFLMNADGVPSVSATIHVVQPPSTGVAFEISDISDVTAGAPKAFTITAMDTQGNPQTDYVGTVHFTSSDTQARLPIDYTFAPGEHGSHTFPEGAIFLHAGDQTLTATDTRTLSITDTATVHIHPAPASQFNVNGFSLTTAAGKPHTFTVTALDPYGNVDTNYAGSVVFSSSDPQAGLPGTYSFVASDAGVHSFTGTLKTAGRQSITATDSANSSVTGSQTNIQVFPGVLDHLLVQGYPSPTTSGESHSFTVTAQDPYGNTTRGFRGTVKFRSSDAAAVLPAAYTYTAADAGVHTFTATFNTVGSQSLTAYLNTRVRGTQSGIEVYPPPSANVFRANSHLGLGGSAGSSPAAAAASVPVLSGNDSRPHGQHAQPGNHLAMAKQVPLRSPSHEEWKSAIDWLMSWSGHSGTGAGSLEA